MSQRKGCDRSVAVCSQFWLGLVTSEKLEEELEHDHVCMLWKPVSLQSLKLSVIYWDGKVSNLVFYAQSTSAFILAWWDGKVGSKTEENYNSLTCREQMYRREVWLLQQSGTVLADRADSKIPAGWHMLYNCYICYSEYKNNNKKSCHLFFSPLDLLSSNKHIIEAFKGRLYYVVNYDVSCC